MEREANTGILPPEGEESAEFENVNVGLGSNNANANSSEESANSANTPPITNTALEVAPTELNAVAPTQTNTAAARPFKELQKEEMLKLQEAITSAGTVVKGKPLVAKATVASKLASARKSGNPEYNTMFQNAVRGEDIGSKYETNASRARKNRAKAKKLGTVTNTTVKNTKGKKGIFSRNTAVNAAVNVAANVAPAPTAKKSTKASTKTSRGVNSGTQSNFRGVNSGTQASFRGVAASAQTNMKNKNILNSVAMSGTVDAVLDIAESIGKQLGEMKRMIKTLKAKRTRGPAKTKTAKAPKAANGAAAAENSSLLGLGPLPGSNVGSSLSTIQEVSSENNNNNNGFTPPA